MMKKQQVKKQLNEPVKPKSTSDREFYGKIENLHNQVKAEMKRRQLAGEKWMSLHPMEQHLFIILTNMEMFLRGQV